MRKNRQKFKIIKSLSVFGLVSVIIVSAFVNAFLPFQISSLKKHHFEGKIFNSKLDLLHYIKNKYLHSTFVDKNQNFWLINKGTDVLYFNDPKLLRDEVCKNIVLYKGLTSIKNIDELINSSDDLNGDIFSKVYFDKNIDELKVKIYRGKNNSIHLSEKSAKKSYLSIHDAYFFNGIYFRSKEELKLYLDLVYLKDLKNVKQNKNNQLPLKKMISVINDTKKSQPIDKDDLFSDYKDSDDINKRSNILNAKKQFVDFVSNASYKYLKLKSDGKYKFFSKAETDIDKLISLFNYPEYVWVNSNNGHGSYVVDLDKEDEYNLYGPYYTVSNGDIEMMTDKNQWKKVPSLYNVDLSKEKDSEQLASFLNLILTQDEQKDLPINIKFLNKDILEPYFDKLKKEHSDIYKNFEFLINSLKKGKKFNTFYSIIIYSNWLINNLISSRAKHQIILETKKVFNEIAKYIDKMIKVVIPDNLLLRTGNDAKFSSTLSFENIFNFNNVKHDLNADILFYIDIISKQYSEFINAINIINIATVNLVSGAGALPFNFDFLNEKIKKTKTYLNKHGYQLKNIYISDYKHLWSLFSNPNLNTFFNEINNRKTSNQDVLEELTKDIMFLPSIIFSSYKSVYEIEPKYEYINDKDSIYYEFNPKLMNKVIDIHDKLSFENFSLMKYIVKNGKLEYIDKINNLLDKDSFSDLQLKLNLQNYANQLMIENDHELNIYNNPFLMLNNANYKHDVSNKFNKTIQDNMARLKIFEDLKFISEKILKIIKQGEKIERISLVLSKISKLTKWIGKAFPYIDLALAIFNLVVEKTETFSYIFKTTNGIDFVWDGGYRNSRFWGLLETLSNNIDDMKLIEPKMIISPTADESFYFNGKWYNDEVEVKKAQLKNILNNNFESDLIKTVYSFEPLNVDHLYDDLSNTFEEFGKMEDIYSSDIVNPKNLIQFAFDLLKKETSKQNGSSEYVSKYFVNQFVFANGFFYDIEQNKNEIINSIITSIKPIKIVQLPVLINGKPKYRNDGKEDKSLNPYEIPGISWINGKLNVNQTNNNYIISVLNQFDNKNNIFEKDLVSDIEKRFLDAFEVETKTIIKHKLHRHNLFSNLSDLINSIYIFEAKLPNNYSKFFYNKNSAIQWLLLQYNFTLYFSNNLVEIYKYKDKKFSSKEEFLDWIIKNGEVKYE